MKWIAVSLNLVNVRKTVQNVLLITRMFSALTFCTALFFFLLGVASFVQSNSSVTPVSSMKGFAASVSSHFFMDMIAMEVPHLKSEGAVSSFSQNNVMSFVFRILTDVNIHDPKSFVAREVPGMSNNRAVLLRKGIASHSSDAPIDHPPAMAIIDTGPKLPVVNEPPLEPTDPPAPTTIEEQEPTAISKPVSNVAFIYHSHNQESFLPELPGVKDPDKAYDVKNNITLVGKRLAESLQKNGVGAVHSDADYPAVVPGFNYALSYKYSLATLKEASTQHKDLDYFIDIHRDSQVRSRTTIRIDGKDYAQVYFILGEKNPRWKENEQFASQIHDILEQKHPGISKGLHAKGRNEGNGEYNQSFSPNNILVEIGGPYNSLEECYRTADLLAEAISGVILNVRKADAPAS